MREFKFRVWQGNKLEYFTWNDIRLYDFDPTGYGVFDSIIMQFTGLKDKNGKEIYEGDALKMNDIALGEVIYLPSSFVFKCDLVTLGLSNSKIHYEVIGNIYENPEILEVKL